MSTLRLEQIVIEDRLSKSNIASKVLKQIEDENTELKIEGYYAIAQLALNKYPEFLVDNDLQEIVYQVLSKVLLINNTELLTVTVGKIARCLEGDYLETVEFAASMLGALSDTTILDVELRGTYLVVVPHYELPESIKQYIVNTCYMPPMLVKPDKVTNRQNSGHITISKPLLLGKRVHSDPLNYTAINRQNSVCFNLDQRMLEILEESSKPLDTQDKKDSFKRNTIAYDKTYAHLAERPFYFTNNYDDRGRTYCGGWQVNYQGTDYKKAILNLAHKELIPLD
jgi:hypothetical protein|tara:strand:+ start:1788 stop:2636 length:849 start_codon:yes stop_codon:yes gene_type:complete